MKIRGLLMCLFVLCLSSASEKNNNVFLSDSEDSSTDLVDSPPTTDLKHSSPDSELEDVLLDRDLEENAYDARFYGDENGGSEDSANAFEDEYDPNEAFEIYQKHLNDALEDYKMPKGIEQYFTVNWAGEESDADVHSEEEETKSKLLGEEYNFGTYKPNTEPAPLTKEDQAAMLELHVTYRSNYTYPSANTEFLRFDQKLANIARKVAYSCKYPETEFRDKHIDHEDYAIALGLNMYKGGADPSVAVKEWYSEVEYLDFLDWECEKGKQCGHVTQILYAYSEHMGCARHNCWPNLVTKGYLILCLYYPPGNIYNRIDKMYEKGYEIGRPCSLCYVERGGFCNKNQCVNRKWCEATYGKNECGCSIKSTDCRNCARFNQGGCMCRCKDGWDYLDCSRPCKNTHRYCSSLPGFYCKTTQYFVSQALCRERCLICEVASNDSHPNNLCCRGKRCPALMVLKDPPKNCECEMKCPTKLCYTTTSTASTTTKSSSSRHRISLVTMTVCFGALFLAAVRR